MTPPKQAGAHSSANPRRLPAHRSVSLLHSPRKSLPLAAKDLSDTSSDSADRTRQKQGSASADSPSSLIPLGRDSSGESSNAEKWFDKSNNEVRDQSASFADNDPPFFMRNSSSSETPPEAQAQQQQQQQQQQLLLQHSQQQQMRALLEANGSANSLPLRTGLLQLGNDGSSTEDFRSVIDDLTIENKKLRRRLKKYEKLQDSHLRDEKLFEVRIHGLPPEKKRELEETLRKFASSLGPAGFPVNGYDGLLPVLNKQNTAGSQTSLQNPDSAYASMSASGQGSSAQSANDTRPGHPGATSASRRQNIHTYLHHIPEGLLPQTNPASMTERARKKLVTRRLEQIFAGKGAAVGGHQHSLQQEDVSQSAAQADRAASEARGQRSRVEGVREAHIMQKEEEDVADHPSQLRRDEGAQVAFAPGKEPTIQSSTVPSGEQRPTRPLDLDPHRAQIPAENLRYMRHLGFSPQDPNSDRSPKEGHGWIYLNLLINMAQLHTINVTSDFVRKALQEHSSKFEISRDGRKVRWKGGQSVTRTSSSGGDSSSNSRADMNTPDGQSPRKRPKLTHRHSTRSGGSTAQAGALSTVRQSENNKLVYTPLFFHRDTSEDGNDSSEEDDVDTNSPFPAPVAGDSSGMTSSGMRTITSKKPKKRDDGPIIFYNNARFCTDLSGDRKVIGNTNPPLYSPAASIPIGRPQKVVAGPSDETRGPLASASELPEPMDLSDNPIPESMELAFPPPSPMPHGKKRRGEATALEVTGIGGVWPSDNFAIDVESRFARMEHDAGLSVPYETVSKYAPKRMAEILKDHTAGRKTQPGAARQVERTVNMRDLPPSELPPALSFMPASDGSLDGDSDLEDDESESPESVGAFPPSAAPQPVELPYASSDEDEGDEDDDEDDDEEDDDSESDGSLDLLAAARQVDPEAIRAREREYDANMADRLAEEIPAGSSAATAGGGSGFASPVDGTTREEYQKAIQEAKHRARPATLQRAQTSDSMKVRPDSWKSEEGQDDEVDDDSGDDVAS